MAGLDAIMQASGIVGNTLGAVGDLAGAFVQRKEAKRQKEAGAAFAAQQKLDFGQTYSDLFSLLGGQATYKGDTSQYQRVEQEAKRQQIMADKVPVGDQIAREQATRSSANTFARGVKGAKSGTDLMSLAGLVGGQEAQQMQGINYDTANRMQSNQQQANQAVISSIANTAAATARERGLEFESILNKSNATLGLAKERGLGSLDMNWNLEQQKQAQSAAVANSNAAMMSGVGNIFRSMGGGIAQQNMQNQQMDLLRGQMGMQSGQYVPAQPVSSFWKPSFNAANGYDLMNLGSTYPSGWGSKGGITN